MTIDIPRPRSRTIDIATISLAGFQTTIQKEKRLLKAATTFAISAANVDLMLE